VPIADGVVTLTGTAPCEEAMKMAIQTVVDFVAMLMLSSIQVIGPAFRSVWLQSIKNADHPSGRSSHFGGRALEIARDSVTGRPSA